MLEAKPAKPVLKDVTVTLGAITARVDLMSVQQSKSARAKSNVETKNLCPTCTGDVPLGYQLWCEHGHGPFVSDEARKAITVKGEITPATTEQISEVKAPTVAPKTADLRVFPAHEVEAATMPNGNMFRLRSEPTVTYGVIRHLVADRSKAFVCEMALKGKTCLYRAVVQRDTIVLVELVRPERMLPSFDVEVEVDDRVLANARLLADALTEQFVPEHWADERTARLETFDGGSERIASEPSNVEAATAALMALLDAA
jgi:hypothetical protein